MSSYPVQQSQTQSPYDLLRYRQRLAAGQSGAAGSTGWSFPASASDDAAASRATSSSSTSSSDASAGSIGGLFGETLAGLQMQMQGQGSTRAATTTSASSATDGLASDASGGSGSISQSELEQAFTSQADQLLTKLDQNGDDTIDPTETQQALTPRHHRHGRPATESASSGAGESNTGATTASGAATLLLAQELGQAA